MIRMSDLSLFFILTSKKKKKKKKEDFIVTMFRLAFCFWRLISSNVFDGVHFPFGSSHLLCHLLIDIFYYYHMNVRNIPWTLGDSSLCAYKIDLFFFFFYLFRGLT